jgi:hypothetical protein
MQAERKNRVMMMSYALQVEEKDLGELHRGITLFSLIPWR